MYNTFKSQTVITEHRRVNEGRSCSVPGVHLCSPGPYSRPPPRTHFSVSLTDKDFYFPKQNQQHCIPKKTSELLNILKYSRSVQISS